MVSALADQNPAGLRVWLRSGGLETMRSYGAETIDDTCAIPGPDFGWMATLPTSYADAHRIYVHAGLEPGVLAAEQSDSARLWIRDRFLRADASEFPDRKHIVHGHTSRWIGKPVESIPELLSHRTNLDTGAYNTGVLTIGVFDDHLPGGPSRTLRIEAPRVAANSPP